MKKPSMQKIADQHGLGLRTIKRYKAAGIDIYDDSAIKDHRKYTVVPDCKDSDYSNIDAVALKKNKLIADTQLKQAQARIAEITLEKTRGSVVSIDEVMETNLEISGKIKAQLKRLIVEIPPKCEGLDAQSMTPIIREQVDDILAFLYGEFRIEDEETETA